MESRYIHEQHNVPVLMYHVVCAAKYQRVVMSEKVDAVLKGVRLEFRVDRDHAHFLVQSVPRYSPTKIVQTLKRPEVKKQLWGGEFSGEGYFVNTVGQHGSEKVIAEYVKRQGQGGDYRPLHKGQMELEF